jgi:hypothetical protein
VRLLADGDVENVPFLRVEKWTWRKDEDPDGNCLLHGDWIAVVLSFGYDDRSLARAHGNQCQKVDCVRAFGSLMRTLLAHGASLPPGIALFTSSPLRP